MENYLGSLRYGIFYVLCGLAAGILQFITAPYSGIPMLGASGAIAGVLGAYIIVYPGSSIDTLVPLGFFLTKIQVPAFVMLGYWFVIQLFSGLGGIGSQDMGGVAFWAHVGGFIAGIILVKIFKPLSPQTE